MVLNKITGTKSNLIKFEQNQSIVLMFFPDVLKFFNRLGVRQVNDVTAQVTAQVTAGMDPEGMGAHMGAGLQVVEAVPFDQSVLLNAITSNGSLILTNVKDLHATAMNHLDKGLKKEGDARKKDIKGMKAALNAQNKEIHQRLELHNVDLQHRLELLEQGAASSKKPRHEAYQAPAKTKNIIWNKLNNSFGWKKTIKGHVSYNNGFSCAEDALLVMKSFVAAAVPGGALGGAAGGPAGSLKGA